MHRNVFLAGNSVIHMPVLRELNRPICATGLMKILGPKREEVTGGWRKLYNETLRGLQVSPDTTVIKSVSTGKRHVLRTGGEKTRIMLRWRNLKERDHLEELGVCGILERILKKQNFRG
jgi:hypothetical protein